MLIIDDNALLDYELTYKNDDAVLRLVQIIKDRQCFDEVRTSHTYVCSACGETNEVDDDS